MTSMDIRFVSLVYTALLGAAVGSFLNVVICRMPLGQSLISPRSACPKCHMRLQNRDNIPLLSFILLGGRCRFCKTSISPRYFCVELLTLGLFCATWVRFDGSALTGMWLVLDALLIAIVFLDIDYWWIPDSLSVPGMLVALGGSLLPDGIGYRQSLWGLAPAFLLWLISYLYGLATRKEAMGFGDIKLMALLGLALGARDAFTALMLASFEGAVLGLVILWRGGHQGVEQRAEALGPTAPPSFERSQVESLKAGEEDVWVPPPGAVPFGPFLALATFQVMLLPDKFATLPSRIVNFGVSLLGR